LRFDQYKRNYEFYTRMFLFIFLYWWNKHYCSCNFSREDECIHQT